MGYSGACFAALSRMPELGIDCVVGARSDYTINTKFGHSRKGGKTCSTIAHTRAGMLHSDVFLTEFARRRSVCPRYYVSHMMRGVFWVSLSLIAYACFG